MYSRRGPWKRGVRLLPVSADEPDYFALDTPGESVTYMTLILDGEGSVTGLRFPQIVDMYRNPDFRPWT